MKQHITPKQFQELPKEISCKVFDLNPRDWRGYKNDFYGYHHKKITIGKMIELLNDNNVTDIGIKLNSDRNNIGVWVGDKKINTFNNPELCDSLWDAVKHMLNEIKN